MADPYIKLEHITKSFDSVYANKDISVDVYKGEILALLGENGSGKSTLVNMLSGIYTPDSGTISIDGKKMHFGSPGDAIKAGIGMVHQHFKLVDVMTAAENVVMGHIKHFVTSKKRMAHHVNKLNEKYGLNVTPDKKIYNMSVSEKQAVEIMKVFYRGANVLILDEPTAVLTPQEITALFSILRKMKEQGCTIIIITHKMAEVMDISDRVTVLRKGECIGTVKTSETTPQQLTEMMVGKAVTLEIERPQCCDYNARPMLSVKNLTKKNTDGVNVLDPRAIIRKGISMSFVPEDRLGMGLVAGMSITNNVILKSYNHNPGPFIDSKFAKKLAEQIVHDFDIYTPSVNYTVKKLSGGNIQKVLLGREIWLSPKVLITAYPVRGLDIGASYNIYHMLNEQKKKGVAVLFIGEDLDVLKSISDRLMVIHDGEIIDIVDPTTVTKEDIGLMMVGDHINKGEEKAV